MPSIDPFQLESEVKRIASALWGGEPGSASAEMLDSRERDCIYRTEDVTHYIECTTSRTLQKVKADALKMVNFQTTEIRKRNAVKLWIVTAEDPTADQASEARRNSITILSLENFRRRLFDGRSYLETRKNYPWGSATDPKDDSSKIDRVSYRYTTLVDISSQKVKQLDDLIRSLDQGNTVSLLGDYGMGKSLIIREIFRILAARYYTAGEGRKVPVAINLRDHWGQDDPVEVLSRHAKKIGYESPAKLIRAYHAGEVYILLDGFDEIVGIPVASRRELPRLRSEALTVIRRFISDTRGKGGVLVAGRENFFDSPDERNRALGLTALDSSISIADLSVEEAEGILSSYELRSKLPAWLPRRPLFLAYLASRGLLADIQGGDEATGSAYWDPLLDGICLREKKINEYLDAHSIRKILEILADRARVYPSGRGPLTPSDVTNAYKLATGYDEPDEHMRPLLMRLPGLTSRSDEDGSREFIDDSMLNALRSAPLANFAETPYTSDPMASKWIHGISRLGIEIAVQRLRVINSSPSKIITAGKEAVSRWSSPTLAADLVRLAQELTPEGEPVRCLLHIQEAKIEELDLYEKPCSDLTLAYCEINEFVMPLGNPVNLRVESCVIDRVFGLSSHDELPAWMPSCEIGVFDSIATNASIVDDDRLSIGHRVLLTIIHKLYRQSLAGRVEGALVRGLPHKYRHHVPVILDVMSSLGFARLDTSRGRRMWHPENERLQEALGLLTEYGTKHALVERVRKL